jgi:HK97 family phage portal protein
MASLLDRISKLISKNAQQTAADYNRAIYQYLGESILWNPENDRSYIDEGYRKNATVYSLVNIITKAATTIPFQVYEKQSENDLKRYKALTSGTLDSSTMYQAKMLQKNALVEVKDTALHQLLDRPNAAQSYNSWLTELIAFGKLTGNRYVYGIGPDNGPNQGKYTELYILPSQVVEIVSNGIMQPVKEYRIEYNGNYSMDADCVLHIKDFNPYYDGTGSHLYGQSPLRAGLRSLTTNNEAVTTGVKYLQNQTARGVLMSEEGDLNEVQAQQLKDKFRQQYQGSNNGGDVIITPKKLSWVNFGLNASDVSLIEQYNASIKDICNIFNVPVQLLNNTEASTYNNMKEAKKALYQNAVIPELVKLRDELNRWLVPMYGDNLYLDFDFTAVPELQEENDKVVQQLSSAWWITPNEKRAVMNYGKDEDTPAMDDYYIPSNLLPVSNQDIEIPEPAPMAVDIEEEKRLIKEALYSIEVKAEVPGMTDVYTTEEEAQARAEELGGSGTHQHTFDGEEVYMPFDTHAEYETAIAEIKDKEISDRLNAALEKKTNDHNEEVGDDESKRTTVGTLYEVYKRGVGAYRTNPDSVRPTVQSSEQWAMARVNSYLYALKNGKFRGGKHDTDLLPAEHPESSKETSKAESYDDYPQAATNNAKRMLGWIEKYGRDVVTAGTNVGLARAQQLSSREPISLDVLKRTRSYLERAKTYSTVDDKLKDEPWLDNGFVAYNLWGGEAMRVYANKKLAELEDNA